MQEEGIAPHYEIEVSRVENLDHMEVRVEITEGMFASDEVRVVRNMSAGCKAIKTS